MVNKPQKNRIIALLLLICLCVSVLSSCGKNSPSEPEPLSSAPADTHVTESLITPAPTGSPEPTDEPVEDSPEARVYTAFAEAFREDIFLINNDTLEFGYNEASDFIASIERYVLKHRVLPKLMDESAEAALAAAEACYPTQKVNMETAFELPDWQYLAAALPFVQDSYGVLEMLGFTVSIDDSGVVINLSLSSGAAPIEKFAESRAALVSDEERANRYLDVRFTYAYLKAVYNEKGEEREDFNTYSYPFGRKYINALTWPLSDQPWFENSWAKPRSHNTRAHMGTDIKMPEDSPIYSCSDGVVLYKGMADIPGNYVIIMDDEGFEYHYYHMCRLSEWMEAGDRVTSGQQIGDVGNTGNSDAPHLHISIIAPTGEFINPFDLMKTLESAARSNK